MSYHIENPSAGNAYFRNNGNAIGDATQPDVDFTTMNGVLDSSIPAQDYGMVSVSPYEAYTGADRNSIIRGYTTQFKSGVAAATKTAIQINGSDFNRPSIPDLKHMRTNRVATAIRAGYWNPTTGGFSTLPTSADDISAFGADDEGDATRDNPGEFTYFYHSSGYTRDYPRKTQ